MADLPHVPDAIPQVKSPSERSLPVPRVFTPQVTTPQVSTPQVTTPRVAIPQLAELRSPLRDIAQAMQTASEEANSIAKIMATEAGLKSVTRDADGNVQVDKWPIVGDAAISYRNAMQTAAVADGEAVAKMDMIALRKQHEFDPEGFRNAAAAYRNEKVAQYEKAAGAAVGLSLGRAIDNNAIETYRGLLNGNERITLAKAQNSIETQIEATKNELIALAQSGDQSSAAYRSRIDKVGALWGELAANPRLGISPERVEYDIKKLNSELTVGALDYKLKKIQEEHGPEAALKVAETIKTDPSQALTREERLTYHSRLVNNIRQRVNEQKTTDAVTVEEIKSAGSLAAEGFAPTPAGLATLRQRVADSKNPNLQAALENVETVLPVIANWRKASPAEMERNLSQIEETMRMHSATTQMVALRNLGATLLKTMRSEIAKDPLTWADRTGAFPLTPIDFASPDAASQMHHRAAQAESVAAHYGIAPIYLRPDEKVLLQKVASIGGPGMIDVARRVVDGFGAERAGKVLAEISNEAPILAHMGGLLTGSLFGGGSATFANDVAEAVQLRQNTDFKLPRWLDHPSDKILQAQNAKTISEYGSAFLMVPNNGRAAEASAQAAYFARANRQGFSALVDNTPSEAAYRKSLQEAAGATFAPNGTQYGGVTTYKPGYWDTYKVIVPGNVRADRFRDVISAVTDADLSLLAISPQAADGKPYTSSDLRAAVPVAVSGGYRFAAGEPASDDPKWLRGADGRPFVLPIAAMDETLRKRVPQAFQGGR